ncbi:multidrug ABC transporter [Candidatus Gracilibacteria bacterium CG17_big_fil_post_rev_8_21_14_2_50_48_13]|nr:MAG: multidrug ABC transporter [Candidatus Gracilibacteria bacterium CG17_big_fil_post_rev_8_21_14_2_50_48_13]
MNYTLKTTQSKKSMRETLFDLMPLLSPEKKALFFALAATLVNSGLNLLGPLLLGIAIDQYIAKGEYAGAVWISLALLGIFALAFVAGYTQTTRMGSVGQRTLFRLRNDLYAKIQELPIAFFHQNATGDLISRINNDTEKLNQFFSQSLVQFFGNIFIMSGALVLMMILHWDLALLALVPAVVVIVITQLISPWVRQTNQQSQAATGSLSAEVGEGLSNFKAIVAFHRRDYFRNHFAGINKSAYRASLEAAIANQLFTPLYGLAYHVAQLTILVVGLMQIQAGALSIGLLISFLALANRFYEPFRFLGQLWASFQSALAAWDRVARILSLKTNLPTETAGKTGYPEAILKCEQVSFSYEDGTTVLHDINVTLMQGKTYALVGPTGGGKTTTASLFARLYDPSSGTIYLKGKDIRTYTEAERTSMIGFILQDPFLFSGTVQDNIVYGHPTLTKCDEQTLLRAMDKWHIQPLIQKFPEGLSTTIARGGEGLSLGQKQLIAFMRAVLREPELLILDEATANVDTVTEQLLEDILAQLPKTTTKVIIAHRLGTIENADEIFFINGGTLTNAESFGDAVALISKKKSRS